MHLMFKQPNYDLGDEIADGLNYNSDGIKSGVGFGANGKETFIVKQD